MSFNCQGTSGHPGNLLSLTQRVWSSDCWRHQGPPQSGAPTAAAAQAPTRAGLLHRSVELLSFYHVFGLAAGQSWGQHERFCHYGSLWLRGPLMFGAQAFAFRRWLLVWATGELQAERSVRRYRVAAGMAHGALVCESYFGVWPRCVHYRNLTGLSVQCWHASEISFRK